VTGCSGGLDFSITNTTKYDLTVYRNGKEFDKIESNHMKTYRGGLPGKFKEDFVFKDKDGKVVDELFVPVETVKASDGAEFHIKVPHGNRG
jgi:hypothetical protein